MRKWLGGITAAVIAPIVVLFVTQKPPAMGGDIADVQSVATNPCCTLSAQVSLKGFYGEVCHLRATIVNTSTGEEAPGDEVTFIPEADEDQARSDIGVSADGPGTYVVRFILYDPDGVELDRFTSQQFVVA